MTRTLLAILLVLLAGGCGGEAADAPKRAAPERPRLPTVEPVPLDERAAFALRCLTRGPPLNSGMLTTSAIHTWNVELAMRDLANMAPQTLRLLDDASLRQKTVENAPRSADAWINVLRLLQAIPNRPEDLALAWSTPAIGTAHRRDLAPLRLEAIRTLSDLRDPRAAEPLYRLYEAEPQYRDVAVFALKGLFAHGEPWRTRAVDLALRRSGPTVWEQIHNRLGTLVAPGSVDTRVADLLTWWAALVEGSGPRLAAKAPRAKVAPWERARLWLDPAFARAADHDEDAALAPAYGPAPSEVVLGAGWYAGELTTAALFPTFGYTVTGKLAAADARCILARQGYDAYRASVASDLVTEVGPGRDDGLYYAALHCMLDPAAEETGGTVKRKLRALLDEQDAEPTMLRSQEIQRLVQALPPADEDEEAFDLLQRLVRSLRPLDLYRLPIGLAFDALAARPEAQRDLVTQLLFDDDRASLGVALTLIRRARSAEHLPALEKRFAATRDDRLRETLRRLLIFVYSTGEAEPRRLAAFVERLLGWFDESSDAVVAGTAGTLLDFGDAGIAAFCAGLRGPRRSAYLAAWPRDDRIVPVAVAEAAVLPVGPETSDAEVLGILRLAYRSFPVEAAPLLAWLERRRARQAAVVAVVLERVRHRAPLPGA